MREDGCHNQTDPLPPTEKALLIALFEHVSSLDHRRFRSVQFPTDHDGGLPGRPQVEQAPVLVLGPSLVGVLGHTAPLLLFFQLPLLFQFANRLAYALGRHAVARTCCKRRDCSNRRSSSALRIGSAIVSPPVHKTRVRPNRSNLISGVAIGRKSKQRPQAE